jgi:hypothetical protein
VRVGAAGSVVIKGVDTAEGLGVDRAPDRVIGDAAGEFTGEGMGEVWGDTVGEGAPVLFSGAAGMGASGAGGT